MSDWTYEMLRYAFHWNTDSRLKATRYVVASKHGGSETQVAYEVQLMEAILISLMSDKDEDRCAALIFLEECCMTLIEKTPTLLDKLFKVFDSLLGASEEKTACPGGNNAGGNGIKSHVLVTYTSLLIQCDAKVHHAVTLGHFIDLLAAKVRQVNRMSDRLVRATAVECMHELEVAYPGLMFPFLGHDWFTCTPPPKSLGVGESLGTLVNAENLHVRESYAKLFFTTFLHFTELMIQEAQKGNVRGSKPRVDITPPAYAITFDRDANNFPLWSSFIRTLKRSISLVLESLPMSSSWTKILVARKLKIFVDVLDLEARVVFHHFCPLLLCWRVSLFHAFLVVHPAIFADQIEPMVSEAIIDRLFSVVSDTKLEPSFRLLSVNWVRSFANKEPMAGLLYQRAPWAQLCPRRDDFLELRELKLQVLLYLFQRYQTRLPDNFLVVLDSLSEFKYCQRPTGAHACVFRFLMRVVRLFPSEITRLGVPDYICDLLRSRPKVLPSALSVIRSAGEHGLHAVQYTLLQSLGEFVSKMEPPSRIRHYFGLLYTLAQTSWLLPEYVTQALTRIVFLGRSESAWEDGVRILIICREVMLHHEQKVIYEPMTRLLYHLAHHENCVDLRDRAQLYLRLLTHLGTAALGSLLVRNREKIYELPQMLVPVHPRTIRLDIGPVPFLSFLKSYDERKRLGIMDRHCAVFAREGFGDDLEGWETRWGFGAKTLGTIDTKTAKAKNVVDVSEETADRPEVPDTVLSDYMLRVQSSPVCIRLPFVLRYLSRDDAETSGKDGHLGKSDGVEEVAKWEEFPTQIFSLEVSFSDSEHFVPITAINVPYISAEREAYRRYHLLLELRLICPVPTSFGVNITFSDARGQTYFGHLESFSVAFQDMFLPSSIARYLWIHLFEALWTNTGMALQPSCWSVKILEMKGSDVKKLIHSQLGPFIVSQDTLNLPVEDFDFEQEAMFESVEGPYEVNLEQEAVIIFIPPRYHLLMRFTISAQTTIVRILTDRFHLLAHMDAFFEAWTPLS